MVDAEVIIPEQKMDLLASLLCELTERIQSMGADLVVHGFLGGEFGYGGEWENDVFTMRPYYWGDCDCGAEESAENFWSKNSHTEECYQTELDTLEREAGVHWECSVVIDYDEKERLRREIYERLCKKHGLSKYGCAVHCTCGLSARAEKEIEGHSKSCAVELPNFLHKSTGFEVRWYKYIGRDMETRGDADLMAAFNQCFDSL